MAPSKPRRRSRRRQRKIPVTAQGYGQGPRAPLYDPDTDSSNTSGADSDTDSEGTYIPSKDEADSGSDTDSGSDFGSDSEGTVRLGDELGELELEKFERSSHVSTSVDEEREMQLPRHLLLKARREKEKGKASSRSKSSSSSGTVQYRPYPPPATTDVRTLGPCAHLFKNSEEETSTATSDSVPLAEVTDISIKRQAAPPTRRGIAPGPSGHLTTDTNDPSSLATSESIPLAVVIGQRHTDGPFTGPISGSRDGSPEVVIRSKTKSEILTWAKTCSPRHPTPQPSILWTERATSVDVEVLMNPGTDRPAGLSALEFWTKTAEPNADPWILPSVRGSTPGSAPLEPTQIAGSSRSSSSSKPSSKRSSTSVPKSPSKKFFRDRVRATRSRSRSQSRARVRAPRSAPVLPPLLASSASGSGSTSRNSVDRSPLSNGSYKPWHYIHFVLNQSPRTLCALLKTRTEDTARVQQFARAANVFTKLIIKEAIHPDGSVEADYWVLLVKDEETCELFLEKYEDGTWDLQELALRVGGLGWGCAAGMIEKQLEDAEKGLTAGGKVLLPAQMMVGKDLGGLVVWCSMSLIQ